MARPVPATSESTVEALLQRSGRAAVPIRKSFVQQGTRGKPEPGPLAEFVRSHDGRGLKLYLLFLGAASSEPWDVTLPARVWARAANLDSVPSVSKIWKRLAERKLITRARKGRTAFVTALREDGSEEPYTHPSSRREPYLQLPFEFWKAKERWYQKLNLAETAILLNALSLQDGFILPSDKGEQWYGLSADTIERGLTGLRKHRLLLVWKETKTAPLSAVGWTEERHYTLRPPFGPRTKPGVAAPIGAVDADAIGRLFEAVSLEGSPERAAVAAEVIA